MCMNVFYSALCKLAIDTKSGVGVGISPRTPTIPCLLFADDSLLFCKIKFASCIKLKQVMNEFCKLSGQLNNLHKLSVVVSRNASTFQKQIVAAVFNIPQRESLGKYLDYPMFQGKSKASTFSDILGKATARMESWKANSLSNVGRAVLIQSNLESIPSHTMQSFEL